MEFGSLIKPLLQEAKSESEEKSKNLIQIFTYLVEELRSESLMIKPLKNLEYDAVINLAENKDSTVQFIGINLINLISSLIEGESGEKFIARCFQILYKVIQNLNLEDSHFVPSVMTWRKLFIRMKEINENKSSINIGTTENRSNTNNSKAGFKLISNTLFQNVDKLFDQCFGSESRDSSLSRFDKIKSVEFILHALSDSIDMFPSTLKSIVSRKQEDSNGKLFESLIKGIQKHHSHTEFCISIIKILSKMFLFCDKRTEGWCAQISKIVDSINGFWDVCIPVNVGKDNEDFLKIKYESYVTYKFNDPNDKITLSNSLTMMKYLFTLLKFSLNQSRNEPYLIHGSIKMNELLQCLEGIISKNKFDPKGSVTSYLGLTAFEFNIFLTHCKIDALETLRQIVVSYNMIDHFSWLKKCMECVLKSESTIESHNLMCEVLTLLRTCIEQYKFGFARIAISVLVNGKYIISPDIMNHILTLLKIILLRKDKTQIKMEGSKLKAGLKVLENVRDVTVMYDKFSTSNLESKLYQYLKFLDCCIENSAINLCTKKELCTIDNGLQ